MFVRIGVDEVVNQRLAKAMGVAALSIVTMGLFMPQASAHRADNLPAGLDCERFHCNNNTDTDYIVDYNVFCGNIHTGRVDYEYEDHEIVSAHENRVLHPGCSKGEPLNSDFEAAREAHFPSRLPSGSAG